MSSGLYSHTTRGIGTVLTAAIYNADHNNHITNANPSQHGAYSDNVAQMKLETNPGGDGSEVLPTTLAGELERLRYVIRRIAGTTNWYDEPVTSLGLIGGGIPLVLAFNETPLTLRRTENDTTAREIISLGSGSGVGNKFALQVVGTGSNAAAQLRLLLASTEIIRFSVNLLTHFIAHQFENYIDIKEITAPSAPAENVARLYARDIDGTTRLFYKDSTGAELILGASGSTVYDENTSYTQLNAQIPADNSVPTNTEGTEILSADITLKKADSKVRVKVSLQLYTAGNTSVTCAIFRNTTNVGSRIHSFQTVTSVNSMELDIMDEPGTVGPHSYSVRAGPSNSNDAYLNGNSSSRLLGGASKATLFVEEIPV